MIPEIQAKFCISGLKISPEEITNLLGISPTKTWYVEDQIQETLIKRKNNGWCLSTDLERELDLAKPIKFLLQILSPKSELINDICDQYEAEAEIGCVIYLVDETPIIDLDQELLSKVVRLNATIDIDIILTTK